jgi:TolB-like protein/tetratricopeptide (TPR) repeat protein
VDSPFSAYTGTKPYVFVSYSHRDTEIVFPELLRLKESGVNVWYDEGIEAGTEWTDELARAIEGAHLFLYLVTPSSVESQHCRNEVNFATSLGMNLVAVHLKKNDMPGGLSLTLSSRQAIHKYDLNEQEYQSKLNASIETALKQKVHQPITPSKRRSPVVGIALAAALIIISGLLYVQLNNPMQEQISDPVQIVTAPATTDQRPYVLVVPLDISTTDIAAWQPFSDQVTREIIRNLRKVSGMRVVPAPSAFTFLNNKTRDHIRANLPSVEYVLDGVVSIESKGNVRIALTLESLQNEKQLIWDDTFFTHENNTDLFSVQTDVAKAVSNSLQVAILDTEVASLNRLPTDDIQAYAIYREGLELQRLGTNQGFIDSIELFNAAIQLDPAFVEAHIEKAESFRQRMTFFEPPVDMERHVLAAATDAMAIDPDSAKVRSVLGFSYLQSWRWEDAWRYLSEAKSRDPRIGVTHLGLALYYTGLGERQRAYAALAEADDQDPLNPEIAHWGAFIYTMFKDAELGPEWAEQKLKLFPTTANVTINVGLLYSVLGQHSKAVELLDLGVKQSDREPMALIFQAQAYARAGKVSEAREVLEEIEKIESYVCPYETATVYTALDEKEPAFALLDTAVGFRSNCLTFTGIDPRLAPLHNDIRFPRLLETIGLDKASTASYSR